MSVCQQETATLSGLNHCAQIVYSYRISYFFAVKSMKNLLFLTVLFLPFLCFPQSRFLDQNMSGFSLFADYYAFNSENSLGTSLGYSLEGRYDFGLSVSRISRENFSSNKNEFMPYVGFHFLRDRPVSMAITVAYIQATFDGSSSRYSETSEKGFRLTGKIYGDFTLFEGVMLLPMINYSFGSSTVKYNESGPLSPRDTELATVGLDLSVIFLLKSNSKIIFTPRMIYKKEDTAFGLNIGYVIPAL